MQNEIRGINIKKLIWKMVFGWKLILVVAIAFAVLFAGYKYKSDDNAIKAENALTGQISGGELQKADEIIKNYERLNFYEEYYNNSLMFNIDPEKYTYLVLQYYVDSDYSYNAEGEVEVDYTPALVLAYNGYVSNNSFAQDIKELLSTEKEAKYIKELIQSTPSVESFTIQLTIGIPNGYDAKEMENAVDKAIADKAKSFENIGSHRIQKINSSLNIANSTSVEQLIFNTRTTIESLKNTISNLKNGLTSNQKKYIYNNMPYENYKAEFETSSSFNAQSKPSINILFAAIGFVLGAFVVCGCYLLREILSGKMQDEDDLEVVYGIRKFGHIETKGVEHRRFFIDKILYNIKNRSNNVLEKDKQVEYVVSAIKLACNERNIQTICLVQSGKLNINDKLKKSVLDKLKSEHITCDIVSNVESDSESLKKAVKTENVVMLEMLNCSRYKNMENQIKVLNQYSVNILGAVIVS